MKQILPQVVLAITLLVSTTACQKDVLRGEGNIVTETRRLASFTTIDLSGNRQAEIIRSTESKVEITGYQNLVSAYSATINNGRLSLEYPNYTNVRNDNIRLRIYTPLLSSVWQSGNSRLLIGAGFSSNNMEVRLSGNSEVRFGDGQFTNLFIHVSGNAHVYTEAATATHARVEVSGNAKVEVKATETLRVNISGNAEVFYHGNPTITQNISGRGKLIKR